MTKALVHSDVAINARRLGPPRLTAPERQALDKIEDPELRKVLGEALLQSRAVQANFDEIREWFPLQSTPDDVSDELRNQNEGPENEEEADEEGFWVRWFGAGNKLVQSIRGYVDAFSTHFLRFKVQASPEDANHIAEMLLFADDESGDSGIQVVVRGGSSAYILRWQGGILSSDFLRRAELLGKGDLLSASAAQTPKRLAVGADGKILVADSSTATGLAWKTTKEGLGSAEEDLEGEWPKLIIRALKVTTGKIAELAVTAAKIAEEAVETAKIKALAVTEAKLAAEAVAEAKIKNLAVTAAKLGAEAVETAKIKAEAVTEGKIANLAVATGKIAAEAVTSAKIAVLSAELKFDEAIAIGWRFSGTIRTRVKAVLNVGNLLELVAGIGLEEVKVTLEGGTSSKTLNRIRAVAGSLSKLIFDEEGRSEFLQLPAVAKRKINRGTTTLEFGGGVETVTKNIEHGLGETPVAVTANCDTSAWGILSFASTSTFGEKEFRLQITTRAGAPPAGTKVVVTWIAMT